MSLNAFGQRQPDSKSVRSTACPVSADQQHELPAHVTVLADAVRLRDLGEREALRRTSPLLNVTPYSCAPPLVGDRHTVLRAARELDELGQDAAPATSSATSTSGVPARIVSEHRANGEMRALAMAGEADLRCISVRDVLEPPRALLPPAIAHMIT